MSTSSPQPGPSLPSRSAEFPGLITERCSDSLVGSLCREMEALRCRWALVVDDLSRCREESLLRRLRLELAELRRRHGGLRDSLSLLQRAGLRDRLALAFLGELVGRPLPLDPRRV
jgi:hypothetical protein